MNDWLTNDPKITRQLREADKLYFAMRAAAKDLPLAAKVEAFHKAKAVRMAAYKLILEGKTHNEN